MKASDIFYFAIKNMKFSEVGFCKYIKHKSINTKEEEVEMEEEKEKEELEEEDGMEEEEE